jgi:transposase
MHPMPAHRLILTSHLSYEDIRQRERSCTNVVERQHWQIIRLLARPASLLSAADVALVVDLTPDAVRKIVHRYNTDGPDGLVDRRQGHSGRKPVLSREQQQTLVKLVRARRAPDGGLWSGPKVAQWVRQQTGTTVSSVTGWQYLRTLGFALLRPRPRHSDAATPALQTVWKKNAARLL